MHFERHFAFQNANNYIFPEKKIIKKKYVCLPYLKCPDPLPETHLFSIWPKYGTPIAYFKESLVEFSKL